MVDTEEIWTYKFQHPVLVGLSSLPLLLWREEVELRLKKFVIFVENFNFEINLKIIW